MVNLTKEEDMNISSEKEIIAKIRRGKPFTARLDTLALDVKIDRYVPCIGTAIHHGHRVPPPMSELLLLSEEERRFEEDPYTGDLIETLPITLVVNDSRYFYDLNRHPDTCIYQEAWGKKVWSRSLDEGEIEMIREMHNCYYRILSCLLARLEEDFSRIILYDLHSYNYSRINGEAPLFNIGTHYIDDNYLPFLERLKNDLSTITLPGVRNRSVFDEVFQGRGHQAAFIHTTHPKSLCVPLEIKKVFMSEQHFERYDPCYSRLKEQLTQVFAICAARFADEYRDA